jgi:hypothetical protein
MCAGARHNLSFSSWGSQGYLAPGHCQRPPQFHCPQVTQQQ